MTNVDQKGSAMVEFAVVVVLLLVMLFGIIEFGRALYTYHFLSNAARDATRYAAVRGANCDSDSSCSVADPDAGPAAPGNSVVQDYVATLTPPGIDANRVVTTPVWPGDGTAACTSVPNGPGCPVKIEVSYNFDFIFPLVHSGSITLSSTSQTIISH
jgi:Flp pilus assembly protein TadG